MDNLFNVVNDQKEFNKHLIAILSDISNSLSEVSNYLSYIDNNLEDIADNVDKKVNSN